MCGCVFSPGLFGSHRLPVGHQAHEHGLLPVPPLCRGVGVVPVLLYPLYQLAVNAKIFLKEEDILESVRDIVFGHAVQFVDLFKK